MDTVFISSSWKEYAHHGRCVYGCQIPTSLLFPRILMVILNFRKRLFFDEGQNISGYREGSKLIRFVQCQFWVECHVCPGLIFSRFLPPARLHHVESLISAPENGFKALLALIGVQGVHVHSFRYFVSDCHHIQCLQISGRFPFQLSIIFPCSQSVVGLHSELPR